MLAANHLSHDQFFSQLTSLFKSCHTKGHGTVRLSQKRLTYGKTPSQTALEGVKTADNSLWDLKPPQPLPILVRATNAVGPGKRKAGEKEKISIIVQPDELDKFFERYAEICKKGMEGLRKRDRSKKKKDKKKMKKEGETAS